MSEIKEKEIIIDNKITDVKQAISIIINLTNISQQRGAFTLEEASKYHDAISKFKKNNQSLQPDIQSSNSQEEALLSLCQAVNQVQQQGKFSLQEAHFGFLAINFLESLSQIKD